MYFLKRKERPAFLDNPESEACKAVETATTLLADSVKGVDFNAEIHEYSYSGRKIDCVSDIVEYYAPFDGYSIALGCSKNPKHEMYGWEVQAILDAWERKRDEAAEAGTQVHEYGEACFLYVSHREKEIEPKFRDRIMNEGFAAVGPKEEAVAKWWASLDTGRFVPVAKESILFNPVLLYAGTFDLLLYDLMKHYYVLKDYKTNEDLFKTHGGKLRAPLSPIKADNIGKYTLQQNLYRIQLENIGIHVGGMELLWLKNNSEVESVSINNYEPLIRFAMTTRTKDKNYATIH